MLAIPVASPISRRLGGKPFDARCRPMQERTTCCFSVSGFIRSSVHALYFCTLYICTLHVSTGKCTFFHRNIVIGEKAGFAVKTRFFCCGEGRNVGNSRISPRWARLLAHVCSLSPRGSGWVTRGGRGLLVRLGAGRTVDAPFRGGVSGGAVEWAGESALRRVRRPVDLQLFTGRQDEQTTVLYRHSNLSISVDCRMSGERDGSREGARWFQA